MIVFDGFSTEYFPRKNTVEVRLPDGMTHDFNAEELCTILGVVKAIAKDEVGNACKRGVWQPLGHIIGFCKHPDSLEYKCSLCGYQIYTLFGLGKTDRCPKCHAVMSFEEEKKDE